jgi:hypothetical protein
MWSPDQENNTASIDICAIPDERRMMVSHIVHDDDHFPLGEQSSGLPDSTETQSKFGNNDQRSEQTLIL